MNQLEKLVVLSSDSAVASAYVANYLYRARVTHGVAGGEATSVPVEEGLPKPDSFVELVQTLCSPASRIAPNIHNMISTAVSVVKTAVSFCVSLELYIILCVSLVPLYIFIK